MTLQTSVNSKQAFGLVGTFYDDSPRRVAPYTILAAAGGTPATIGYAFTSAVATPEKASAGGSDVFAGVLVSPKELTIDGLSATLEVSAGTIGELCTMGHVIVKPTTAVSIGYVAAYNTTTGEIAGYSAAAQIPETHTAIPNGKFVLVNASVGEVAVLELS